MAPMDIGTQTTLIWQMASHGRSQSTRPQAVIMNSAVPPSTNIGMPKSSDLLAFRRGVDDVLEFFGGVEEVAHPRLRLRIGRPARRPERPVVDGVAHDRSPPTTLTRGPDRRVRATSDAGSSIPPMRGRTRLSVSKDGPRPGGGRLHRASAPRQTPV